MRWSLRLAIAGLVLLAAGFGLPYLIPHEEDYEYVVHTESISDGQGWTVVEYQNLTQEERNVFNAARNGDGSVRREERVNGSHYTHHYDVAGNVAVTYGGESYAVHGYIIREYFEFRFWSRLILLPLGVIVGVAAILAFGIEFFRGSEHANPE